jgi:hypothetical protein
MTASQIEWRVGRIFHIPGGIRAQNWCTPKVDLQPDTLDGKIAQLTSKAFGGTFDELESIGLFVIGVDFYSHAFEVEGRTPPQWRSHHSPVRGWPCNTAFTKWRQIAHASYKREKGHLWDLASRIAHQLRVCEWRVRQVSEAYKEQLHARCQSEFKAGLRFRDGFTWLAYLSIQSFLIDACILRDYFSEFAAYFIYVTECGEPKAKVTTLAGLKKRVLNGKDQSDALGVYLNEAIDERGWLKELGAYRDLVMHSAPLAQAEAKLFAVQDVFLLPQGRQLPCIVCPLPEVPQDISTARARGSAFANFKDQFESFAKASRGESPSKDGLRYVHSVLGRLCELSEIVSGQSPVEPEEIIIDDAELLSPIVITGEGS